jgi:hypothetical protein
MLSSIQENGLIDTLKIGTNSAISSFKQSISYYLGTSNVERDKHHYTIIYHIGTQEYKIRCKNIKSKIKLLSITTTSEKSEGNSKEVDITNIIKPFMGPSLDFHGIPTTPNDLGYDELSFHTIHNNIFTFKKYEIINLNIHKDTSNDNL